MKITVQMDDGKETVYEQVREFALCGLRMTGPLNPQHFQIWSGTAGYLRGQLAACARAVRKKEEEHERSAPELQRRSQ